MEPEKPKFKYPGVPVEAGRPGYNEWGVPLHACHGHIQDAHYWAYVRHVLGPIWREKLGSAWHEKLKADNPNGIRKTIQ